MEHKPEVHKAPTSGAGRNTTKPIAPSGLDPHTPKKWNTPQQPDLLHIEMQTEVDGIGMGVLSDGTYVRPHKRSSPNNTKSDNWSTKGNVNPYTGKRGTLSPDDNEIGFSGGNPTSDDGKQTSGTRTPKLGSYEATPYVRQGPPKAEGSWSDNPPEKIEQTKEYRSGEFRVVPESTKSEAPKVADDHTVYCSMRLREYHWRYDCNLLNRSRPVPLTIKSVKDVGYVECRECRPIDDSSEDESKVNSDNQLKLQIDE